MRSMYAMMYSRNRNGIKRRVTRLKVRWATADWSWAGVAMLVSITCVASHETYGAVRLPLSFVGFVEQIAQTVELSLPGRPPVAQPLLQHREPRRIETARAYSPRLFRAHQTALLEHLQVLTDRG